MQGHTKVVCQPVWWVINLVISKSTCCFCLTVWTPIMHGAGTVLKYLFSWITGARVFVSNTYFFPFHFSLFFPVLLKARLDLVDRVQSNDKTQQGLRCWECSEDTCKSKLCRTVFFIYSFKFTMRMLFSK